MARIDVAYNYLMSTYGKATGSRYDSHKKSELRSLYNNIIKTNKESPLYKIAQTGDVKEFAIDIKANAHRIQNVISSLNADGNDISSMLKKKVAVSSDDATVSVHYVGDDNGEGQNGFPQTDKESAQPNAPTESSISEDGSYTTKEDVALYIHTYGKLPQNFITKKQARELGWGGGSLEPYAPGMCIGGDRFGNYEGLLPEGHSYTECDVNTLGASSRGAERIIFSSDGLIYYTGDHYASFTLLYGEE